METRARFVLIGAFTLAGILGTLALFLWLAKVQVDRQYAYYDVLFEDVSGLSQAGEVRYNGLLVGRVVLLSLYEPDPGKIRVRVEVTTDTPVKTDTYATLEYQGVTGLTYVSLTGGSPEAAPLRAAEGQEVPVIRAERSAVQSLFQATPELLERAIELIGELNAVVNEENRQTFANLLGNLESASASLDTALGDFSALSGQLAQASTAIAGFSETLDTVAASATTTLATADATLATARTAIEQGRATIDEATGALAAARQTFDSANALMADKLPGLIDQVQSTAGTIDTTVAELGGKAGGIADKLDAVSALAAARLAEAEATLASLGSALDGATRTMEAVEAAAGSVDALARGEAAALLAEARGTIARAEATMDAATGTLASARQTFDSTNALMSEHVPGLIGRVEGAVGTFETVAADLGRRAGSAAGRIERLADVATARLTESEATLAKLDAALDAATRTMLSVGETAQGVDALIRGEGAALVADARRAVLSANQALSGANRIIEDDLPAIVAEVRSAAGTVNATVARLGEDLSSVSGKLDVVATEAQATVAAATEIFRDANATLAAIGRTMETAEGTLSAAEGTFSRVNRLVDEDIGTIVADARSTMAKLEASLGTVATDLPLITSELRGTLDSTSRFVESLDRLVLDNSEQIEAFMQAGLPQFVRFVDEASRLVVNLQRLSARIESNPARFLLGTQAPEFTR
ncbi:MAG TPA: MlaD family protein [Thermohalobaculum sp.]|nr:MlaD family protein [Thermohalobaculum sp.]